MTAEIIKKYVWNSKEYCNLQYGDGDCITLKGEIGQYTDAQWVQLALDLYAAQPEEIDPMIQVLRSCSDQAIVDEVIRRHLELAVDAAAGEEAV